MRATVYLSGAIDLAPDLGAGWRARLAAFLAAHGVDVADPVRMQVALTGLDAPSLVALRTADPARFGHETRRVIEQDLAFVANEATCVVARVDAHVRMGTYAELTVAYLQGVPIFVVAPDPRDVSGWCASCAEGVFDSEQALQAHLAGGPGPSLAERLLALRAERHAARRAAGAWPFRAPA